jgi:hypothetical protein
MCGGTADIIFEHNINLKQAYGKESILLRLCRQKWEAKKVIKPNNFLKILFSYTRTVFILKI